MSKHITIFLRKIIRSDRNKFIRAEPRTSSTNRVIYMYYRCPKRSARISEINLQKILIDKLNSYAWIFNQRKIEQPL